MKNFLLNLIFPRQCLGCREYDTWFCDQCFSLIQLNRTQCCYICRKSNEDGRTCPSHLRTDAINRVSTLDGLLVAAHYDGNPILKKAIKELKYHRHADVGEKLGRLLPPYRRIAMRLYELIPIPLHPNRLKQRGFNQAELLARTIAKTYQLPSYPATKLVRIKDTPSQVECHDRQTRLNNPKGAFALNGTVDPETTYVLVDDLVTTGATLEEYCRVLKENDAKSVWGLVLARN